MKKLTAMLLSLMMCLSLLAIPAQAAFVPDPDGPGIIDVGGSPIKPGDDDPGNSIQSVSPTDDGLPGPRDDIPGAC